MHTLPATDIELAAWLRLSLAPGLKPAALRLLLGAFGLPEAIFDQSPETLAAIAGEAAARAALAPHESRIRRPTRRGDRVDENYPAIRS